MNRTRRSSLGGDCKSFVDQLDFNDTDRVDERKLLKITREAWRGVRLLRGVSDYSCFVPFSTHEDVRDAL